jgi:hypothetical protein
MTPFPPNPLVTALAQRLLPQKDSRVQKQAEQAASYAEREAGSTEATQEQRDHAAQARSTANAEALDLASRLAADPTIPPLVTFAGFLGGTITANADAWRVFYLDAKLLTWLLVREDDIVQRETLEDDSSAFGQRDVIWLKSSASVTEGSGSPRVHEIEAQFLRGDFIGAGDFSASLTGGTFSRATGLLCEVQTPGCCGRYTR